MHKCNGILMSQHSGIALKSDWEINIHNIDEYSLGQLMCYNIMETIASAIFLILSIVPTELQPNFKTMIFIDNNFYKKLNILIKYILIVMSTNNEK